MLLPVCFLASILHQCLCIDLTYTVQEAKSPGTYIGDVAADSHVTDSVLPQNWSQIRFTQLEQGEDDSSHFFRIGKKSGKLYTAQTLDAEALCKHNVECSKTVKVAVRRAKTFMKIIKVKVIIKDVNDHRPEFPEKRVEIHFSERDGKGTKISIPNAVDRDVSARNSQIEYFLKNTTSSHFTLSVTKSVDGTSELSLILEERLNREIQDSYTVQVIARDGAMPPKQSILDVHITVTDVNDNLPVFSKSIFNISVSNDHDITLPVIVLTANDLDTGKNGRISYHFSVKTSNIAKAQFEINQITGEIFLQKKFPPGHKMTYKLYVKAMDGGRPPLSSMTMVLVNVINQQNNAPFIDVNFISTSSGNIAAISEDVEVNSFIAYVMVTDHDIGQNGDVSCVLLHEKFELQSLGTNEYKITIKERLDREKEDHYEITITCQDKGVPPLYSKSHFSIQVMDTNDVRPEFSQETFKFYIDENKPSKYPVGYVNVTDPDLGPGGILTFTLLTNNKHFLPFQITDDGLISTVMSLDYEFQAFYEFQVFVKDNGIPSLNNTANVTIEVRDKNDNAPFFTFPSINFFTLDVLYYPHHANITVLQASDSDSQENAFLKYEILHGNEKQLFVVHPYTGLLSFSRVVTQQDAGSYDLEFGVRDSGIPSLSATTSLYLTLTVRNSTSEIQNSAHSGTEDKIHLYLLVVIVLIAVTISVTVTACVSVCILRCKERRNSALGVQVSAHCKCIAGGGRYKCPTHQASYWSSDHIALSTNTDKDFTRNTIPKSKKVSHSRSDQHVKHKTNDVIYQVSCEDFDYYLTRLICKNYMGSNN